MRDHDGQALAYVYFEEELGATISGQATHKSGIVERVDGPT
jgi:hypothetical protein